MSAVHALDVIVTAPPVHTIEIELPANPISVVDVLTALVPAIDIVTGVSGGIGEAPTDGELYAREASAWAKIPRITVGTTAPASPGVGDIWIDTN